MVVVYGGLLAPFDQGGLLGELFTVFLAQGAVLAVLASSFGFIQGAVPPPTTGFGDSILGDCGVIPTLELFFAQGGVLAVVSAGGLFLIQLLTAGVEGTLFAVFA